MAKQKSKMQKPDASKREKVVVALYSRVSTDRQRDEGYSLEVQAERLHGYAKTIENAQDVRLYTDDGYSGGTLDRPAMSKLIEDVNKGEITHVVVVKLDRLSRSQKDTLHLIEDVFIPKNVAFISIQESFNTDTPFGRAMIGILSVFAQLERENIYERTRSGMKARVEAGFWPGGGHAPFGYDYDSKQGILVPNADADKVRYVYDHYLAGESLQKIADDLGLVYEKVAYNILTRKTNAGYIVYNDVEYRGLHSPIIPLETYEEAMRMLRIRASKKLVTKTNHLLAGLLVCGVCGAKIRYQKWGPNKWKLACYSRQKSKAYLVKDANCNNEYLLAHEVEAGVIAHVFAIAKQSTKDATKAIEALDPVSLFEKQLADEHKKLKRLYNLYGSSEDDILLETIVECQANIKNLEEKILNAHLQESELQDAISTLDKLVDLEGIWSDMTIGERRAVLSEVIDHITITHGKIDITMKIESKSNF